MKEGTTDPFASDDETTESDETEQTEQTDSTVSITGQTDQAEDMGTTEKQSDEAEQSDEFDRNNLPRIVTRDSVKDDRDGGVHQLFVYQDTADREKQARRELEDRIGDDVFKLDVREAIYLAGMQNLDDAEEILREWGADI